MQFFRRLSPVRAYRDLRFFLAQRPPYEMGFLALAMVVTGFFVYGFVRDSNVAPAYKRDIIYVQQWRADRTDAEIRAQQKIDEPIKQKRLAAERARAEETRAMFRKMDNQMDRWGL